MSAPGHCRHCYEGCGYNCTGFAHSSVTAAWGDGCCPACDERVAVLLGLRVLAEREARGFAPDESAQDNRIYIGISRAIDVVRGVTYVTPDDSGGEA